MSRPKTIPCRPGAAVEEEEVEVEGEEVEGQEVGEEQEELVDSGFKTIQVRTSMRSLSFRWEQLATIHLVTSSVRKTGF